MAEQKDEIKKQVAKLNKIFADISPDKKKLVDGLIQNAAFMHITLLELQRDIIERGAMIEDMNGNGFTVLRDNPAQKAYTTMISRYSAIIDQLTKLMPKDEGVSPGAELMDFLNR